MDVKKIAMNPWVLGITAIAVIAFFVTRSAASGGTSSEPGVWNPNNGVSLGGFATVSNDAALSYSENMAQIASAERIKFADDQTIGTLKVLDAMQNIAGVFTTALQGMQESEAGVYNARIQADTALTVDRNLNNTRRDMIWVAADVSKFNTQAEGRVTVTNNLISSQVSRDKISADASNDAMGQLFGFVGSMAKLAVAA